MTKRDWQKDWELAESLTDFGTWGSFDDIVCYVRKVRNGRNALHHWLQRVKKLEEENCKLNDVIGIVREYKDMISSFIYALHADWKDKNEYFHVINSWLKNVEETGIKLDKALAELEGGNRDART